jgi:hypothetical protein
MPNMISAMLSASLQGREWREKVLGVEEARNDQSRVVTTVWNSR